MGQPAPARSQAPAAPPQPQRIEVDELTVQEARKGARKQGLIAGVVFVIVGAFLVDLILLPFSYRRRELFFPCCRTCVSWCH